MCKSFFWGVEQKWWISFCFNNLFLDGFSSLGLRFRQLGGLTFKPSVSESKGSGHSRVGRRPWLAGTVWKSSAFCGNLRSFCGPDVPSRVCLSPEYPLPIRITWLLNFGIKFERIRSIKFWYKYLTHRANAIVGGCRFALCGAFYSNHWIHINLDYCT